MAGACGREGKALVDDVVAARVQIASAIMLKISEDIAIEPNGDLVAVLLQLLRNDYFHEDYPSK
jgi:hypothetical protein